MGVMNQGMIMYIFEINIPGAWLGYEDRDWTHQVEMLLRSMESQFYEANLTLNMFIQAASSGRAAPSKEQWEADAERQRQIREEVEKKYPDEFDPNTWDAVRLETDVLFKREQWGAGRLPRVKLSSDPGFKFTQTCDGICR